MKKTFLSLLAFALVGVAAAQTADEVNTAFNEAAKAYQAKNYAAAVTGFESTIELAGKSSDEVTETLTQAQGLLVKSYLFNGASLAKGGNLDEALVQLQKSADMGALVSPSDAAKANKMIGTVYSIEGANAIKAEDYATASEKYANALAVDPKNTKFMIAAGQTTAKAGDIVKAYDYYNQAIELGATHSKYEAGAESAKEALSTDITNFAAQAKDYDTAAESLNKIVELDPDNVAALTNLVKVANNFKKYDVVIANGAKTAELQDDADEKSNIYFLLAAAQEISGDKTNAIANYKKVTSGANAAAATKQAEALSK